MVGNGELTISTVLLTEFLSFLQQLFSAIFIPLNCSIFGIDEFMIYLRVCDLYQRVKEDREVLWEEHLLMK